MAHVVSASRRDPAPALGRGLRLLRHLESRGASSLERLAADQAWPKSSVARLLTSLEQAGVIRRDPVTRRYHALVRLAALASEEERLDAAWRPVAHALAQEVGHTVELHRFDGRGLHMIDRCEPESAIVWARARIGFVRDLDELDALTQLVLALGLARPRWPRVRFWAWIGGRKLACSMARVARQVAAAARDLGAVDLGINPHGVRRYAAPVFQRPGELAAIVAVAQVCPPQAGRADPGIVHRVRQAAAAISRAVQASTL